MVNKWLIVIKVLYWSKVTVKTGEN